VKETLSHIFEITFTLILAYLVIDNSFGVARILQSAGGVYTQSIKALQGRD
jgi:hypothetical protein